jgi:hypothetical protein
MFSVDNRRISSTDRKIVQFMYKFECVKSADGDMPVGEIRNACI